MEAISLHGSTDGGAAAEGKLIGDAKEEREQQEEEGRRLHGVVFFEAAVQISQNKPCSLLISPTCLLFIIFCPKVEIFFSIIWISSWTTTTFSRYNKSWIRALILFPRVCLLLKGGLICSTVCSARYIASAMPGGDIWFHLLCRKGKPYPLSALWDYRLLAWNKWQKENPFHFLYCAAAHTVLLPCRCAHCAASP